MPINTNCHTPPSAECCTLKPENAMIALAQVVNEEKGGPEDSLQIRTGGEYASKGIWLGGGESGRRWRIITDASGYRVLVKLKK